MQNKALAYGQLDNKAQVVTRYAPLVKRIAHHLLARLPASVQLDDLVQAGMLGLLEASGNFDASKGASFETFAGIRIRGAMLDEIRRGDWTPRSVHRNGRMVNEAMTHLEMQLGRDPTDSEIAEHLQLSLEEYYSIVTDVSVGRLVGLEDLTNTNDSISSEHQLSDGFGELMEGRFQGALAEAIKTLPEREALVLSLYYTEEMNLKEIGLVLGVSESRVSQIHSQTMVRLKSKLQAWQDCA